MWRLCNMNPRTLSSSVSSGPSCQLFLGSNFTDGQGTILWAGARLTGVTITLNVPQAGKGAHAYLQDVADAVMEKIKPLFQPSSKAPSPGSSTRVQDRPKGESSKDGFHVVFATEFLNMQRSLASSDLWVLYKTEYGETISPLELLAYVEITSLYSHPINISSYSAAIKAESCGWLKLTSVDARGISLLWAHDGIEKAQIIDLQKSAFDYLWTQPIPAYGIQFGKFLLASDTSCDIKVGSHVQLKISLTDSAGESYT